jgi:hypothetical protein
MMDTTITNLKTASKGPKASSKKANSNTNESSSNECSMEESDTFRCKIPSKVIASLI